MLSHFNRGRMFNEFTDESNQKKLRALDAPMTVIARNFEVVAVSANEDVECERLEVIACVHEA